MSDGLGWRIVAAFLVVGAATFVSSGCAVGYGVGTASASYGAADPDSTLQSEHQVDVSTLYHEVRIIDSTGLLLAALVNTGKQYTARQEAMQEALDRGDTDGDGKVEFDYSYEPMPIMPGVITDMRLRFAAGDPEFDYEAGPATFGSSYGYFALDIKSEFYTWTMKNLHMVGSMFFGMLYENYTLEADVDSFSDGVLDVTYGAGLGWAPHPNVIISGRAQLGLVTWMVTALVGGPEATYLHGTADLEVGWRPLDWLTVSATGSMGRMSTGGRPAWLRRLGMNLMLEYR